ncbi:discoidin domain-containing receptor 2 isoform X2 [Octopus bimaculoides]|nr:discoidin domain-containing receptor 2 isoform X2 [Octopus bimaculoides]
MAPTRSTGQWQGVRRRRRGGTLYYHYYSGTVAEGGSLLRKSLTLEPLLLYSVLHLLLFYQGCEALDLEKCRDALGMQTMEIPDSAIVASSSYDEDTVGPINARIRTEKNGGAWCPKNIITKDTYEYLQINLGELYVITDVETQGRFGNGKGQEYAEAYVLEYQREDNGQWLRFRDRAGEEVFRGNQNTYRAELRGVSPPIIAKRIRFIPYSEHPRTVCMRVEMYGCQWADALLSYSMPQGHQRGTELELYDYTYDGMRKDGYLSGGVGQLTDGLQGNSNFRMTDSKGLGVKGYDWVGWRNNSDMFKPIEIIFKFDGVRNFSEVFLYCNNAYKKYVRVFRTALISFSNGGKYYRDEIKFYYVKDTIVEYARDISIDLKHNIGRYIKMQLFFEARWIMISEVRFESTKLEGNFSDELPPSTTHSQAVETTTRSIDILFPTESTRGGNDHEHSRNDRQHKPPKAMDDSYVGIIIGALAALIIILFIVAVIIVVRHRRSKHNNNQPCQKPVVLGDRHVTINLSDLRGGCTNDSRDYAVPDVTKSSLTVSLPPRPPRPPKGTPIMGNTLDKPPNYEALYAAADIVNVHVPNIPSLQGVSGNNIYAVPNADLLLSIDYSVAEFPRDNLKFIEVLGEGQFGEVHLCEAARITDFLGEEFVVTRTTPRSMLVAVKMLRPSADDRARADFHKEIKIMSQLKDPNIVRVLGVCTQEEPLCMIVEYMKYGDLNQFILEHVPESPVAAATNAKTMSYGCLIFMASQIASGMKYLESLNMVHRDLATRNCLVGHNYCIKISDFGMSRSLYSADYYRIEGRAVLPIRWMAWESILLGKFTTKSDVWSFAVTLWEILTFAKEQPYEALTDEQVIENAGHYYRNDGRQVYLPQPPNCPKEIYDLMRECWNRQESERPSFREIHMFLQRKNMGYNPKDEKMNQIKVPIC